MTPKGDLASTPFWKKQVCSKPMSAPRLKAGGVAWGGAWGLHVDWFLVGSVLDRVGCGKGRNRTENRTEKVVKILPQNGGG